MNECGASCEVFCQSCEGAGCMSCQSTCQGLCEGCQGTPGCQTACEACMGCEVRLRELWAERGRIRVGIQPGGGEVQRH